LSTDRGGNAFAALGLATRPDLTDDDVRAAWRRIAAATHPDRADGGDPDRFALAAAAYTVLRTRSGRGEALADLADLSSGASWRRLGRATRERAATGGDPAGGGGRTGGGDPAGGDDPAGGGGRTGPAAAPPGAVPLNGQRGLAAGRLLSRLRRGRVVRLALRVAIAAAISAGAAAVAGAQPATPALIVGAITWLLVTGRSDLAPPG
jgi:curved DNA-binding protein CbpA